MEIKFNKKPILYRIFPLLQTKRPKDWISSGLLLFINLIPIAGILFFKWPPMNLLIIYWAESAIIGFFNVFKMLIAGMLNKEKNFSILGFLGALFFVGFFIIHYGMFMAGHAVFLGVFFFTDIFGGKSASINEVINSFSIFNRINGDNSFFILNFIFNEFFLLCSLFISHLISFIIYFIKDKEFFIKSASDYMAQPYGRIIIMHITIIGGAFLLMMTGWKNTALIIVWIIIKITADLVSHSRTYMKIKKNTETEDI